VLLCVSDSLFRSCVELSVEELVNDSFQEKGDQAAYSLRASSSANRHSASRGGLGARSHHCIIHIEHTGACEFSCRAWGNDVEPPCTHVSRGTRV